MTSESSWPAVGTPVPMNNINPNENPGWEILQDEGNAESQANVNHVVILSGDTSTEAAVRTTSNGRRPRSATIGGEAAVIELAGNGNDSSSTTSGDIGMRNNSSSSSKLLLPKGSPRRKLRRCASTPDLLVSDNAHEVIVEDESDSDDNEDDDDVELLDLCEDSCSGDEQQEESFEIVDQDNTVDEGEEVDSDDELIMIDDIEDNEFKDEESATLVSSPSVGTSSWTMASSAAPSTTGNVWGGGGMHKSPSFKDILAKNIERTATTSGVFGEDKAATEAKLRDSHRRHHLRVRTKPKFIVVSSDDGGSPSGAKKMMKHAHSTGDLSQLLSSVSSGHESSGSGGALVWQHFLF